MSAAEFETQSKYLNRAVHPLFPVISLEGGAPPDILLLEERAKGMVILLVIHNIFLSLILHKLPDNKLQFLILKV